MRHRGEYKEIIAFGPDKGRFVVKSPERKKASNLRAWFVFLWAVSAAIGAGIAISQANKPQHAEAQGKAAVEAGFPIPEPPSSVATDAARVLIRSAWEKDRYFYCNGTNFTSRIVATSQHCVMEDDGRIAAYADFSPDGGRNWVHGTGIGYFNYDVAYITYDPGFQMPTAGIADPERVTPGQFLMAKSFKDVSQQLRAETVSLKVLGWKENNHRQSVFVGELKTSSEQEEALIPGTSGTCLFTQEGDCAGVLRGTMNPNWPGEKGANVRKLISDFGYNPDDYLTVGIAPLPQNP